MTEHDQDRAGGHAQDGTEYLIFVPGLFRCTECGFQLSKATIHAPTGNIGLSESNLQTEACPNDGTMMVKMTWKEQCEAISDRLSEEFANIEKLKEQLAASRVTPEPWAYAIETPGGDMYDGEYAVFGDERSCRDQVENLNAEIPEEDEQYKLVPLYRAARVTPEPAKKCVICGGELAKCEAAGRCVGPPEPAALRELRELRELSEKATPGPWKYSRWKSNRDTYMRHGIGNSVGTGQVFMARSQASGDKVDWQFIVACVNYVRAALSAGKGQP